MKLSTYAVPLEGGEVNYELPDGYMLVRLGAARRVHIRTTEPFTGPVCGCQWAGHPNNAVEYASEPMPVCVACRRVVEEMHKPA